MTNLSSFTESILKEESGETVRDAIINAANYISKEGSNSSSLNGIPASKFATNADWEKYTKEFETIIKFDTMADLENDTDYAVTSEGVMTALNMYNILVKYIRPSLKKIMNYEVDPEDMKVTKEAIFDYLNSFAEGRESIFDSLIAKGQKPEDATCFRDIPDLIRAIGQENPVLVEGTLDKEKKYILDKNEQGRMQAYSKVTINVPNKTETGSGSENNKKYTPKSGKLFSSFRVSINASSQSASSRYGSGRGGSGSSGSEVDENNIMAEKSITENGDYLASEETVNGYAKLSVHVQAPQIDSGTMFTVRFKEKEDSTEYLGEVQVPPYGTARFDITPDPPSSTFEFAGWFPSPTRVVEDMDVVAKFRTKRTPTEGEITFSWGEILAERGENVELGQWKSLELGTINGHAYGTMIFQKVANGEDGSSSSWVSKTVSNAFGDLGANWALSACRNYLNSTFLDDLATIDIGPEFMAAIMPVRKKSLAFWGQDLNKIESTVELETIDRVWVPSAAEMLGGIPETFMLQVAKRYLNLLNPDGTYVDTSHNSGFFGNYGTYPNTGAAESGRLETRYTSYADTYGGVNYTTTEDYNGRLVINITPKVASNYVKYLTSNTSTAADYSLRTLADYGYTGESPIPGMWGISSSGTVGGYGGYVPIGFCL